MKRPSKPYSHDLFTLIVAVAVAIIVWFSRAIFDFITPPQDNLLVPNLVGLNEADAVAATARDHLSAAVVARRSSDHYPIGVVMSQEPLPETNVREGRRVSLIVSDGLHVVAIPDLRYRSAREVNLIVNRLHLRIGKTKIVESDVVDAGHVVDQDPAPLTQAREGDAINLSYAKGSAQSVTVDNFIGFQIDDARDDARVAKIRLGQIVWTPFGPGGPPRGVVVRQKPAGGTVIDAGDTVSLQVSAGPHQFGYLVREIHAAVTVPLDVQAAQLRVIAVDEMGSRPVFDGFGSPGQRLDLVTTTIGPAVLNTYLNNQLIDTTTVAKEPKIPPEDRAEAGSRTTVDDATLKPKPKSTASGAKEH